MQKRDNLFEGKEARDKLRAGIDKVARAVRVTMGTGGSNALIESIEAPGHMATNDGYTIVNSIKLADPIENMGRGILKEAIDRANKQSGDGSSTTCLVTSKIIDEGSNAIVGNPMALKKSLEDCIPLIEEALKAQSKEITVDDVGKVASISAEDEQIGAKIQEIYQQIGKSGIIHWDVSKTAEDTYTIGKGLTIDGAGYLSQYMCDIDEKSGVVQPHAKWKDANVLIVREKITTAAVFENLFRALNTRGKKEIVVFCDDIEATVVPQLINTRINQGFKTLVVKMPTFWKDQWFEDLAKASGATIIDPNAGVTLKMLSETHLGTFQHVTVTKDDTYIDGIKDLTEWTAELEARGDDESRLRASRLNTKTARYYVGAHSDSALSYRRLKVEDAISAAWQALNGGIVAGGGVALRQVADTLPQTVGGAILGKALYAPEEQIALNSGYKEYLGEDFNKGLNSRTGGYVDMLEAGIVDPTNVVLNACKNAISVAAAVLTCGTIVVLPREEELSQGNNGLLMR